MRRPNRFLRLALILSLGMTFFGCVGLPRRKPLTEPRRPLLGNRRPARTPEQPIALPAPPQPVPTATPPVTTIPAEPNPVPAAPRPSAQPTPARNASEVTPPGPPSEPVPTVPTEPIAVPPAPSTPPPEPMATQNAPAVSTVRRLFEQAEQRYEGMDAYIVRLTRREWVKGKYQPEEILLLKLRKQPLSVYLQWVGTEGKGREAVYIQGQHESKIHTLLAAGDMPFAPAGKRVSLSPDSMLVRNSSRHSITEAGMGGMLRRLGQAIDAQDQGDTRLGSVVHLGPQKRAEFADALETVEWRIAPGVEPALPRGGKRWCFFNPHTQLPAVILTHDERNQPVEYYRYDHWQFPVKLDDNDFHPDLIWGGGRNRNSTALR